MSSYILKNFVIYTECLVFVVRFVPPLRIVRKVPGDQILQEKFRGSKSYKKSSDRTGGFKSHTTPGTHKHCIDSSLHAKSYSRNAPIDTALRGAL